MTDFWTDVGDGLKAVAPVIAGLAGGPAAGAGVSALISAVWPGDPNKSPDDLAAAVKGGTLSLDQLAAMRKADQDFQAKLKELDLDEDKLKVDVIQSDAGDRASARAMQTAAITMGRQSWTAPSLAFLITAGFFGLLGVMLFYTIPVANKDILDVMTGSLGTAWVAVVSFYFGSSHGKQAQDAAMAQIAAQPSIPPGTTLVDTSKGMPWAQLPAPAPAQAS